MAHTWWEVGGSDGLFVAIAAMGALILLAAVALLGGLDMDDNAYIAPDACYLCLEEIA